MRAIFYSDKTKELSNNPEVLIDIENFEDNN